VCAGQPCYFDARCLTTSTDPFNGVGCGAGGFTSCRACYVDAYNSILAECPEQPSPPPSPLSPPSPAAPGSITTTSYQVAIGFVAAEPIETFTSAVLNNISTSVATAAGVDPGNVIVTASAASTRIDIIITTPSATASTNIEENMAATMFSDASTASSVLGLTVTSAPTITSQTVLTIIPPAMSAGLPVPDAGSGTMLTVQIAVGAGSLLGGIAAILLVIRCRRSRGKSAGRAGNTHRAFGRSRAQVGFGASTSSRTAGERGAATHGIALEEDFDIVKADRPVRQTDAAVRPARDREDEATIDLKKDKDLEAEATIDFVKKNKPVAPAFASIASALDSSSSAASIAPPALPPASVAGGSEGGEGDCLGGGGEGGGGGGECGGGEGGRGCGNGGGGEGEGGGGDSISWPRQPAQSYET